VTRPDQENDAGRVLPVVRQLVAAIHRGQAPPSVSLLSDLECDLGIYSLERLELAARLEQAFGIRLPADRVVDAASVADLAAVANGASIPRAPASVEPRTPRRGPVAAESYEPSLLFTLYVALLLTVMAPVVWLLLLVCPRGRRAAALLRWSARTLVRAAGCPIEVRGLDHLRGLPSSVVVANHESFVDSVILLAALPNDLKIAVNERLPGVPMVGTAIRKAAHLVVNRATVKSRLAGSAAMVEILRTGESLLVFPEGTTARAPALLPFRLGAFAAAVGAGRPIVPIALSGTT